MKTKIVAVLIVTVSLVLAITSVWNDAPIVDEIPHIGAGYSYIAKGDHRLNPEHPPLAKDLAGLSLKYLGIKDQAAFESKFWQKDINGQWEFGRKLIFNSGNNADQVSKYAKMPMLIFFILSAAIIFVWTRRLYGNKASLMALFLFAFSPTVLAHSRFVTTDMPALFGILLASYFFIKYLEKQTQKNLWLAGLVFGVAQLTKFSVFLLVPFFVVLAIIYGFINSKKPQIRTIFYCLFSSVLIIIIGFVCIVWPVYYFHTWNYPPQLQKFQTEDILRSYGNRHFADPVVYLSDKPVIRGLAEYGLGLLMVTQRQSGGNTTYFMGEVRNWAWPQYFLVVYFLKEPLAFWGLALIVLIFGIRKIANHPAPNFSADRHSERGRVWCGVSFYTQSLRSWIKTHFTELTMFLWLILYWYTSISSNLNIGVRHLLPVYGFTYILLVGQLTKIIQNAKVKIQNYNSKSKILSPTHKFYTLIFTFLILFGWYLYENVSVYPYYLTYFNQAAGGPSGGYRYVVDSNLDWGQDLKRLSDWVDKNNIQKISLDYFGWSDQTYYLKNKLIWIRAGQYKNDREFLADNPNGGYLAVSASYYMGSREKPETSYAWLDHYKPITVIGNSIFVWYIAPTR